LAPIDSSSTHSFINPTVLELNGLKDTSTALVIRTASEDQLISVSMCANLKFKLQNKEFHAEVRVLAFKGYDLVLGTNWIFSFDFMCVNSKNGEIIFDIGSQEVVLQIKEVTAELKLSEARIDLRKEFTNDSSVFVAHLFHLSQGQDQTVTIGNNDPKILQGCLRVTIPRSIQSLLQEF
jgi:Retroviral aspartyl protease